MIDSRSLGGFIGEKGALKHKCISYEWKKPLSRLAKDHVTMLQAGKQLECLINEQVRLQFDLTLLAHIFSAKNKLNKGQTISERMYEVIVSPKIQTKYFKDFCPSL